MVSRLHILLTVIFKRADVNDPGAPAAGRVPNSCSKFTAPRLRRTGLTWLLTIICAAPALATDPDPGAQRAAWILHLTHGQLVNGMDR